MNSRVMTGILVAIGSFAVWQFLELREARRHAAKTEAAVAALADTVEQVQSRPAPTSRYYETKTVLQVVAAVDGGVGAQPSPVITDSRSAPTPTELRRLNEWRADRLARRFLDSGNTSGWSTTAMRKVSEGMHALEASSAKIDAVDCRADVCRVSGTFDSITSFNKMMFATFSPENGDGYSVVGPHGSVHALEPELGPDGKLHTSVYIFQDGIDYRPERESTE